MGIESLRKVKPKKYENIFNDKSIHKISIRELRGNLAEVIESVSDDEKVIVERHGKPVIMLISLNEYSKAIET